MSEKAAKDLKEAMGSLGDWKSKLASRREADDKERRHSHTDEKGHTSAHSSSNHVRKGSASFFGDSFNALVGAKDGKPVLKDIQSSPLQESKTHFSNLDGDAVSNDSTAEIDPVDDPDLPGHPIRAAHPSVAASDPEAKNWEVDAQGWVYTDNQWEKPTSKGGMGRYTRRRAWVRRAIVVEKVEDVDLEDEAERDHALAAAARLGLSTKGPTLESSSGRESKKEK